MASIIQRPVPPNTWLYRDDESTGEMMFSDYIIRPGSTSPWNECTDEFKAQWELEHSQPQPEEQPINNN